MRKKVVAYHEIGHALVAALQTDSAPVQKITIIPRTSGALGYTMQVEQNDKVLMTREELENKIATLTGGTSRRGDCIRTDNHRCLERYRAGDQDSPRYDNQIRYV